MAPTDLAQNPFALLSSIAAPALLTNSSSVLALSTTNRMLRTRDLMRDMLAKSVDHARMPQLDADFLIAQVMRIQQQSGLLLSALHGIYMAMGSFAAATLITLIGAVVASYFGALWIGLIAIVLGAWGVACLIFGTVRLFQATQLSLVNIGEEARLIRERFTMPVPAKSLEHEPADDHPDDDV